MVSTSASVCLVGQFQESIRTLELTSHMLTHNITPLNYYNSNSFHGQCSCVCSISYLMIYAPKAITTTSLSTTHFGGLRGYCAKSQVNYYWQSFSMNNKTYFREAGGM